MPKKTKKRDEAEFIDDGRTVVNMNVEGMPWYHQRRAGSSADGRNYTLPPREGEAQEKREDYGCSSPEGNYQVPEKLTGKERRAFIWGVTKAVLLIAGVFVAGYLLFILFCLHVWFR